MRCDHSAAKTERALIEDDRLSRCNGALRLIKSDKKAIALDFCDRAFLVRLAVADFCCAGEGKLRRRSNPGDVGGL